MNFNQKLSTDLLIFFLFLLTIMPNNLMAMEKRGFQQLLSDLKNNQYEYLQENRTTTKLSVKDLTQQLYINNFVPALEKEASIQKSSIQEPNITAYVCWSGSHWYYVHALPFFYYVPSSMDSEYEGIDVWVLALVDHSLYYYARGSWNFVPPTSDEYDFSQAVSVYREYTQRAPINYSEIIPGYLESNNPPVYRKITYILGYDTDPNKEFDESSFCYILIDATNLSIESVAYADGDTTSCF